MKNTLIYVVDDEKKIRDLISTYLQKEGYEVQTFEDGESALKQFKFNPSDMLILDIMMSEMDGYSLCRELRKISDVPIIMVSAKDEEIDRILGLELGSDDYISKPFSPRELVVRVKTILRRTNTGKESLIKAPENKLTCMDVTIYPDERRIVKDKAELELTPKEYDFLAFLIKNKNKVFTREQLITSIWGYDYIGDTRAIDDLVKKVRKKLVEVDSSLQITTVWGYGYKVCG
ncbi:MAG: response regulator transcription factor [Clostridia bacterium]|nr:response regulator transcription factor [Clostridia bacterium]